AHSRPAGVSQLIELVGANDCAPLRLAPLHRPEAAEIASIETTFPIEISIASHALRKYCAPGRTRTCDPLLRRQPLYPLSYRRVRDSSLPAQMVRTLPPSYGVSTTLISWSTAGA